MDTDGHGSQPTGWAWIKGERDLRMVEIGFMIQRPLSEDLVPKSFMDQFGSLIKCVLGGWDRLRFHASLRPLFSPQWMRTYLCAAKIRLVDFAKHAQELTGRLLEAGKNVATTQNR